MLCYCCINFTTEGIMKSWSFKEDYLVCQFYLNNVDSWKARLDELMMLLFEYGFKEREKGSVRMRIQNYESLHIGKGLSNVAQQSREIYSSITKRLNNPEIYALVKKSLDEGDLGSLVAEPNDLESYLVVGDPPGDNFYKVFWNYFMASGLTDPEVYHSCNMGKDTFWRIANNKNAGISKKVAVQLCFGLRLSYEDSLKLLGAAGYTLYDGISFDYIVMCYLKSKIYDVNDVNITLYENKVPESLYLLPRKRKDSED